MVSGLVTSPDDHSRICLGEARPMRIASKSLMSINGCSPHSSSVGTAKWRDGGGSRSFLDLVQRQLLGLGVELGFVELLSEHLVVGGGQLAVLIDAVAPLLQLLSLGVAGGGPAGHRPQVDAELLGGAQQLVVPLADRDGSDGLRPPLDLTDA